MTNAEQQLRLFIAVVLSYGDKNAIRELLANLGYDLTKEKVNVDLCLQAMSEWGKEFWTPFSKIARRAKESSKFQIAQSTYSRISKSSGDDVTSTKTSAAKQWWDGMSGDEKNQFFTGWFDRVANVGLNIFNGINTNKTIKLQTANNNSLRDLFEAQLAAQQAQNNAENQGKTNNYLLIGGGVLLVVILIIVLAVVLRKR